ncbi:hypothetical protein [Bradyrhizobium sp. S69]|uniref:hypothetical protein n=1 Tax=Bradyrhizobium sp. S69 TaxID=1641856 RepID=UPI00131E90D3|nr:hypothetical protein [Bradyrhizobium sp. S69]
MTFSKYFKAAAVVAALFVISALPAAAQSGGPNIQQDIINSVVQNIIQNVRDQIYRRRLVPASRPLGFGAEDSDFDSHDPFAANGAGDPFSALAYTKAIYSKAPPVTVSNWLYGANLVGSGDRSSTFGSATSVATVTGAFDVTKIGIFTATDALTFIGTGSDSWSHTRIGDFATDTSAPAGSGTLSYLNGAFSADFTSLASWSRSEFTLGPATEASTVSYTENAQYRFDLPYTMFVEPTVGVTYTEAYTANFAAEVSDMTEVHGGARAGIETKWMGYTVQPVIAGSVYQIVDSNLVATGLPLVPSSVIGYRGSAKVTVIWNDHFSSYLEGHASGMSGSSAPIVGFATTQVVGAQAGLRYTWN